MSTKFQLPCGTLTTGFVLTSLPVFAGQGMGVSQPVIHLERRDRTNASRLREARFGGRRKVGQPQTYKNVLENFPSPMEDVLAIGPGPTLAAISSGGVANDH